MARALSAHLGFLHGQQVNSINGGVAGVHIGVCGVVKRDYLQQEARQMPISQQADSRWFSVCASMRASHQSLGG